MLVLMNGVQLACRTGSVCVFEVGSGGLLIQPKLTSHTVHGLITCLLAVLSLSPFRVRAGRPSNGPECITKQFLWGVGSGRIAVR